MVTAAIVVAVVVAGGAVLFGSRPSPAGPSAAPATALVVAPTPTLVLSSSANPTADVFPNAMENALLKDLPPSLADACSRGPYTLVNGDDQTQARPIASLSCPQAVASGANGVIARRFADVGLGTGNLSFTTDGAISGIVFDRHLRTGDCATASQGNGRWQRAGAEVGAIVCYVDRESGDAMLWWSYAQRSVLVQATNHRGDSKALYAFFQTVAPFIAP